MACEFYLNKAVIFLKIIKEPQIEIGKCLWVAAKPPRTEWLLPIFDRLYACNTSSLPFGSHPADFPRFCFTVRNLLGTSSTMPHFLESGIPSSKWSAWSRPSQSFSLVLTISRPGFKLFLATGLLLQRKSHVEDLYIRTSQSSSCAGLGSRLTGPGPAGPAHAAEESCCAMAEPACPSAAAFPVPLSTCSLGTRDTRAVCLLLFHLTSYPGVGGTFRPRMV